MNDPAQVLHAKHSCWGDVDPEDDAWSNPDYWNQTECTKTLTRIDGLTCGYPKLLEKKDCGCSVFGVIVYWKPTPTVTPKASVTPALVETINSFGIGHLFVGQTDDETPVQGIVIPYIISCKAGLGVAEQAIAATVHVSRLMFYRHPIGCEEPVH